MSVAERLVVLDGSPNFRDIGGYVGAGGRRVRWGRVYRSGSLARLTVADLDAVASLGIGSVFDLRAETEARSAPDPDLGARRVHLPVIEGVLDVDALTAAVRTGDLTAIPPDLLVRGTAQIATEFRAQWSRLLADIVARPGTVSLIHCTGGKDRTGWASAVVLGALGVARDTVMADYLLTNACLADQVASHTASVRTIAAANQGIDEDAVDLGGLPGLLGVRSTYLQAAFDAVDAGFGSFDAYLVDGLGFTEASIARLRADLLD